MKHSETSGHDVEIIRTGRFAPFVMRGITDAGKQFVPSECTANHTVTDDGCWMDQDCLDDVLQSAMVDSGLAVIGVFEDGETIRFDPSAFHIGAE